MNYTQHPLSAAFPAMPQDDFRALVEDMRQHGQRDPATLYDGMVVDGWHRYRACDELGIPCRFEEFSGDDAVAFVRSKNQHRRHYQKSQQAAIEVALSTWAEAHRPKKGAPGAPFSTREEMARRAGTGERTIVHAKRAHEAGLGEVVRDGLLSAKVAAKMAAEAPELAKQVARGEVSLPAAVEQITGHRPGSKRPPDPPEDVGPDESEIDQALAEEKANQEFLQKLLESDDKLAAAHAEVKRLNAELISVKLSRDGYMNKCNELIRRIKALERKSGSRG